MASYNKVILMGNLTRDIELRHTPNNQAVANFGLAMNRNYKTASGEEREEVTFVDCEAWGRTAEIMSKYLHKGKPVFVEGRLRLDTWQDKDGNRQSRLRVVVDTFQFIDSKGGGGGGSNGGGGSGQHAHANDHERSYSDGGNGGGHSSANNSANNSADNSGSHSTGSGDRDYSRDRSEPATVAHQAVSDEDIPF